MLLLLLFIVGLVFGSFYHLIALRVPKGESILFPGSHCPECGHRLKSHELIPLFSFAMQQGKCRHCFSSIPLTSPAAELSTGILFVISPLIVGWKPELFLALTLASMLIIISFSDLEYMIIPNKILIPFFLLIFFFRIFVPLTPWWNSLTGSVFCFALLYIINLASNGKIGMGDVKLFAVIGLATGLKTTLLSFYLSALFGSVFAVLGLLSGSLNKKTAVPFAPFIALGTLVSYFWGESIITLYEGTLFNINQIEGMFL
ncbi:prepilin peptidase [Bacillus massilinigeriensis]|uniref:prepilin peptidase n=1 Tax=Bacillus mediterraneensis TaxID=1805474 RepID=UPI0008F92549|nr:A24 family peptidase [Bacillus mediterraneensis]